MLDLHRLDLFEIAHAHGISREEAADFVVRCEKDAGRDVGAPTVLKLTNAVPRRAAINTGRYYTAASWRLENPAISRSAIQAGQAALNARSGGRRLFVSRLLSE